MNARLFFAAVTFCSMSHSAAFAYATNELPLETKVAHSDVVVVGKVVSIAHKSAGTETVTYAIVRVQTILKGDAPKSLEVLLEQQIVEMDPKCCIVGHRYLFFLAKARGIKLLAVDRYWPVNARFGIYDLDTLP